MADSLYPDRIVVGASDAHTLRVMRELYAPLVNQSFDPPEGVPRPAFMTSAPMVETSLTSAEMIKYAANAFLAMKIGFANEIANICERVGAEGPEVMRGIGLDTRIGSRFLNAGVGWGGSCFGKDVNALLHTAREYGYEGRLLAPRSKSTPRSAWLRCRSCRRSCTSSRAAPSRCWASPSSPIRTICATRPVCI